MVRRRLTLMRINRSTALPLLARANRDFTSDIIDALDPQRTTTRYSRTWRLSRPQLVHDQQFLWGKLGFQGAQSESDIEYDEEREDFITVPGTRGRGRFAYFVLDVQDRYLGFEEVPPDIRRNSFSGALKSILASTDRAYVFDVDFVADTGNFSEWIARTERISRFYVALREPNPDWKDRPQAERELMEESHASTLSIEAKSSQDGPGLEIEESDLAAFSYHAGDGYGNIRSTGQTQDGRRTFFDSERKNRNTAIDVGTDDTEESLIAKMYSALKSIVPQ